jgi:hypothetical protein
MFINLSCLKSLMTLRTQIVLKTLMTPTNEAALVTTEPMTKSTTDRAAIRPSKIFKADPQNSTIPNPISLTIVSNKNNIVKTSLNMLRMSL